MDIKHLIGRHQQLIILSLVLIAIFFVTFALRSLLLPLFIGIILAYIFLPIIRWFEGGLPWKGKLPTAKRILGIFLIYTFILALLIIFFSLIVPTLGKSFSNLLTKAPQLFSDALLEFRKLLSSLPLNIQTQFDTYLSNLGNTLGISLQGLLSRSVSLIPATISFVVGLIVLPIFLFYILKDWEKLVRSFYAGFSPQYATYARNIIGILDKVLGQYIRAVLLLGVIVFIMALIPLLILGIPYAPVLALIAGITELIPTIGPWIGGAISVLIMLATAPEKAILVIVVFAAIQILENQLLVPRIQGGYLKVHPAIAIVVLILGAHFGGLWGLAFSVPLTAVVVRIYKYFHQVAATEDGLQK